MRLIKGILPILTIALSAFTALANPGLDVGDYAKDFQLKNVDGKMVSLADYKDAKGFIIVFTCNHCPFAQKYEERIISLNKKYSAQGYPVIAINPNDETKVPEDSYDNMVKRSREKKYGFPYLYDESQEVAQAFGAARTPHVFLLKREKEGKYRVAYIGAIDNDPQNAGVAKKDLYVEDAIAALEANKTPDPASTKAIGCTIKWK